MPRCPVALLTVLALGWSAVGAQTPARSNPGVTPAAIKQESVLGLRLQPLPAVLYAQLPDLPPGMGVLVDQVIPESVAQQAGLRRFDILLSWDGKQVKDRKHLLRLVQANLAGRQAPLVVVRAGKEMTLHINLAELAKRWPNEKRGNSRGAAKNGRPPALSVKATPVGYGKLAVTFEYYAEGTGKLKQNKCCGSFSEIEAEVRKLPMPVQDLARVALERLRNRKVMR